MLRMECANQIRLQISYKSTKPIDVKKAHIAVSLILLVAETGIEPVTRGFSIPK
jgi:hypothetical protein